MVELLRTSRFLHGWTLRGPRVFEWLVSQRPPGFCVVWLFETPPRYSYGWTHTGFSVFVRLYSHRPSGIRMIGFLEARGIRMVGL